MLTDLFALPLTIKLSLHTSQMVIMINCISDPFISTIGLNQSLLLHMRNLRYTLLLHSAFYQFDTKAVPCVTADWSKLGDFEMTTPIADLLQEISDKGIPTSKDEVSHCCCVHTLLPTPTQWLLCI